MVKVVIVFVVMIKPFGILDSFFLAVYNFFLDQNMHAESA